MKLSSGGTSHTAVAAEILDHLGHGYFDASSNGLEAGYSVDSLVPEIFLAPMIGFGGEFALLETERQNAG